MSLILDALRRAHEDRERGRQALAGNAAPGLLARVGAEPPADKKAPARGLGRGASVWVGAALLLASGWTLSWVWRSFDAPSARALVSSSPPAAPPTPVLSGFSTGPVAALAPIALPVPSPLLPPRASTKPKALAAAASSPTRHADSGERLPTQAELPEPQRQATAGLVISGSVFSADAASRFLIVRGEVVREGAELGPGWALEEIRAREAVFRVGRLRYRQAF